MVSVRREIVAIGQVRMLPLVMEAATSTAPAIAEATEAVPSRRPADTEAAPERIGVVFVHGIGSQTQSSTLRMFADPLVEWLTAWHADTDRARDLRGDFRIVESRLSYGEGLPPDVPAHIRLRIPAYAGSGDPKVPAGPAAEWILTEGWWAARLEAPEFARMAPWSVRIYGQVILRLVSAVALRLGFRPQRAGFPFVGQVRMPVGPEGASPKQRPAVRRPRSWSAAVSRIARGVTSLCGALVDLLGLVVLLIGYVVVGFVGLFVVVIPLSLIAQIPIRKLQELSLVGLLRLFLIENIGDFYTYLYDEIQALHIRRGVLRSIDWLERQGCRWICLAAHSQGTVVALDTLTQTDRERPEGVSRVTKLITAGEALNNAWLLRTKGLRRLRRESFPAEVRWIDLWSVYDPVPGDRLNRVTKVGEDFEHFEVRNTMNVLTEHGGYFENPEEFVSRLAQEIDRPRERPDVVSRFWLPSYRRRQAHRVGRLRILLFWRLVGMLSFGLASLWRGGPRIVADGTAVVGIIGRIPGVSGLFAPALALPGEVRSGLYALVGVAAYGAVFELVYLIALLPLWRAWDRRVRAFSAKQTYPRTPWPVRAYVALATLMAIAAFGSVALLIGGRT